MFEKKEGKTDSIETIIGPSVTLEGNFDGNGDIIIEGSVIGTLKTSGTVKIGTDAKIKAEIKAHSVFISGEVKGNIESQGTVELAETAKVTGNIKSGVLHISAGAYFQGKSAMGTNEIATETSKVDHKEKQSKSNSK